jgi:glycerol kinase
MAGMAQKEFAQYFPKPGWVEHDPMEIWSSQNAVIGEVLAMTGVRSKEIAAIGITNQRETTIVWDRSTGKPIHPAIVWQDRRTARRCESLKKAGHEALFRQRTGLLLDPYFSGTKLAWILENVEGARQMASHGRLAFGTVDTWLLWNLTNGRVHATDASNASRTLLMNIESGHWDPELLEILNIPESILPEIRDSSGEFGKTSNGSCPEGIPIAGIAGDQQAALFGQACMSPGLAKNTYGTGCFMLMPTGGTLIRSNNNLLTTVAWKIGGKLEYALEGSVFVAGAAIQWLRDELGLVKSAQECDELAASVENSNGLFIVPAFTGLGAPHWDPNARGLMIGLTRGINRAHICRATLEAIAFQTNDLIRSMESDSGQSLVELRVDGGASRSDTLMQFQADLLGVPVVRPDCIETTALGAAYLAGLATDVWQKRTDIASQWRESKRYLPDSTGKDMELLRKGWAKAVQRATNWEDS